MVVVAEIRGFYPNDEIVLAFFVETESKRISKRKRIVLSDSEYIFGIVFDLFIGANYLHCEDSFLLKILFEYERKIFGLNRSGNRFCEFELFCAYG